MTAPKTVELYKDKKGREPYRDWLSSLKDSATKARIDQRVRRIELGNPGVHAPVGEGVWELKLDFGPGYRVYYGEQGNNIIILLCGGNKDSQERDIIKAKKYWKDYMES